MGRCALASIGTAILLLSFIGTSFAHLHITGTSPTVTSCGTSPAIAGNDEVGVVTIGTGVVTSCVVNFSQVWKTPPVCVFVSDSATAVISQAAITTALLGVRMSVSLPGAKIYYMCKGIEQEG